MPRQDQRKKDTHNNRVQKWKQVFVASTGGKTHDAAGDRSHNGAQKRPKKTIEMGGVGGWGCGGSPRKSSKLVWSQRTSRVLQHS